MAAILCGCNESPSMSGSGTAALANEQETTQEDSPTIFVEWPELGVDFVHRADTHKQYSLPRTIGSGTAVFDYNGDGLLDLYLIQNSGAESKHTNRLYRLGADLRYVDVSSGSGLDVAGYGMGAAAGDVNNDGRVDLLLTEYGHARLFRNRSEGDEPKFEEITAAAGIENPYWGTSAAFLDFDRDGWLDLVVVNYMNYDPSRWCADGSSREEFCGPDAFPGRMAKLYRNRGAQPDDQVRFEDVTVSSGLAAAPGPGLGIFCADFDGDRWPDMFIANDGQPNHLWINQRDGRFVEEGISRGLAYNAMGKAEANMGVAVGDVDGDNLFDLYVTHLTEETHTLWRQEPRGYFLDRTAASKLIGAASRSTGFGTAMADVDNDGDLDLMLVNGRVTRAAKPPASPARYANEFWLPYAEPNQLLLNTGDGHFVNAASQNPAYCREPAVSRGLAVADLNDDGGLDLIVTRVDQPPGIYRNVHPARGHWLLVRVVDSLLHRDAYGAEVTLRQGEKVVTRHVNPGYSFLCSNDPRCHFGLGDAAAYAAIEVVWPDGTAEMFAGGKADQVITLERGAGRPLEQ